jgi:hypothetical protein
MYVIHQTYTHERKFSSSIMWYFRINIFSVSVVGSNFLSETFNMASKTLNVDINLKYIVHLDLDYNIFKRTNVGIAVTADGCYVLTEVSNKCDWFSSAYPVTLLNIYFFCSNSPFICKLYRYIQQMV